MMDSDSAIDLLSSLETGYRSRQRRAQRTQQANMMTDTVTDSPTSYDSTAASAVSASLTRRLLAVAANNSMPQHDHHSTLNRHADWIHSSFERMNHDVQTGVSRSEAVNRLRERMSHPRSSLSSATTTAALEVEPPTSHSPPPATHEHHHPPNGHLLGILRQVRTQTTHHYHHSKLIHQQTYLLYCGHRHPSSTHEQSHQQGCGKLISVRAALVLPTSFRSNAPQEPTDYYHHQDHHHHLIQPSCPQFNLLTSDTLPFPNSADRVDPITQQSFENDPCNPFHPTNPLHPNCTCEKAYLGCLSCGNILGHSIITPCNFCRELAVFHPHFYYLNRLTALPRYNDAPISLDIEGNPMPARPEENLMSWAEAARRRKKDVDSGYVQSPVRDDPVICAPHLARLPSFPSLSSRVRNAILMGSLVDDEESSWRNDRPRRESIQPSSPISEPSRALSDHNQADSVRRASLSRRPAVRLPAHLSLDRRPIRPRASSTSTSESWVLRESRTGEDGFPRELLQLRRESDMASAGDSGCPTGLVGPEDAAEGEVKEDDDDDDYPLVRRTLTDRPDQVSAARHARRTRTDLEDDSGREMLRPGSATDRPVRVIRRRIDSLARPPASSSHLTHAYRAAFHWAGDVCAR